MDTYWRWHGCSSSYDHSQPVSKTRPQAPDHPQRLGTYPLWQCGGGRGSSPKWWPASIHSHKTLTSYPLAGLGHFHDCLHQRIHLWRRMRSDVICAKSGKSSSPCSCCDNDQGETDCAPKVSWPSVTSKTCFGLDKQGVGAQGELHLRHPKIRIRDCWDKLSRHTVETWFGRWCSSSDEDEEDTCCWRLRALFGAPKAKWAEEIKQKQTNRWRQLLQFPLRVEQLQPLQLDD